MRCRLSSYRLVFLLCFLMAFLVSSQAADNLQLNPHLNVMKNGKQGPLISGDNMGDGVVEGMPNYIIFYAGFCYNAKRQAERTVQLYNLYKGRVHFVIVDWTDLKTSLQLPPAQQPLSFKYFRGELPHTTILDRTGKTVFDYTGEVPLSTLIGWLDSTLWLTPADQSPQPGDTGTSNVSSGAVR